MKQKYKEWFHFGFHWLCLRGERQVYLHSTIQTQGNSNLGHISLSLSAPEVASCDPILQVSWRLIQLYLRNAADEPTDRQINRHWHKHNHMEELVTNQNNTQRTVSHTGPETELSGARSDSPSPSRSSSSCRDAEGRRWPVHYSEQTCYSTSSRHGDVRPLIASVVYQWQTGCGMADSRVWEVCVHLDRWWMLESLLDKYFRWFVRNGMEMTGNNLSSAILWSLL